MKAFVFGASGYIGGEIARTFARAGWTVYGFTRTQDKVKALQQNEIIPVVGTAKEHSTWVEVARHADVIIEALADYADMAGTSGAIISGFKEILKTNPHVHIIYTSGVWVHGDTGSTAVDESAPLNPTPAVAARVGVEKQYTELGATILRPGCVYGKAGSLTGFWFGGAKSGKLVVPGTGNHHWVLVHVDDLAAAYLLVAQKPSASRGQIFIVGGSVERVGDAVAAIAKAANYQGQIEWVKPADPFQVALALDQRCSSHKIRTILGWNPLHESFVGSADRLFATFNAYS